jgi:hypothetical protein
MQQQLLPLQMREELKDPRQNYTFSYAL